MKYLIIIGFLYLLFSISVNIKSNLKNNNKVLYLNILGFIIVLIYLIRNILEL